MADAARNLSPWTMDDKTRDSYSSALIPIVGGVVGGAVGVVVLGAVVTKLYNIWKTRNQQPEVSSVENPRPQEPLLQPSTGGRRLTRHRKNHNRKTRAKRRT